MDLGVGELQLRLLEFGNQLVVLPFGLVARRAGIVKLGLGGGFLADQGGLALQFDLCAVEPGGGDGDGGFGGGGGDGGDGDGGDSGGDGGGDGGGRSTSKRIA